MNLPVSPREPEKGKLIDKISKCEIILACLKLKLVDGKISSEIEKGV